MICRRNLTALAVACGLAWATSACTGEPETFARVLKVETLAQTIGGPAAAGAVGDYLLENDRIRVVIHGRPNDTGTSVGFGGSIIDADLTRPERMYGGGNGLDQFFELGPMLNLQVPKPDGDDPSLSFHLVRPKADEEGGALLRVEGARGNVIEAIGMLGLILPDLEKPNIRFITEYELRPGEPFVRITTTAYPDGDVDESKVETMAGFDGSTSLLAILLGDVDPACETNDDCTVEGESCQNVIMLGGIRACRGPESLGQGAMGAWLALMGGKLDVFVPGAGFDPWLSMRSAVAKGLDFFANPVPFPFYTGVGDRVSYAMTSGEGDMLVPLASSNFTVAITNARNCPTANPACLAGRGVKMTAFLSVGAGDVGSAVGPLYAIKGVDTGRLEGVVVDARTGQPESGADVFVFEDPWPGDSDGAVAARSYDAMVAAHRELTRSAVRPSGDAGLVSHFRSDVGTDPHLDGDFGGLVPAPAGGTRYILVPRRGTLVGALHPVRVSQGATSRVTVVLAELGSIDFEIQDGDGVAVPAKLTLGQCLPECARDEDCAAKGMVCDGLSRGCRPKGGCSTDGDCDPDERCDAVTKTCHCRRQGRLPRELGGHWIVDGVIQTTYTGPGPSTTSVAPGVYEAIFSRGFEYSIDRQFFEVFPSRTTRLVGHVDRVVDTSGYISADFHVHGGNSPDSGLPLSERVLSFAGEGVEFLSSSDHDVFTDYAPHVFELGLDTWLTTQMGVETSPIMLSHFLAFPLQYDELQPQNMPETVAFDWQGRKPAEIIADMRSAGSLGGGGDAVVVIPHIYDYFNYYGLDTYSLMVLPNVLLELADPVFEAGNFSAAYDGMEIANGKSQDFIRRPTVAEVVGYTEGLDALTEALVAGDIDMDEYADRHIALGRVAIGAMLERMPGEQSAFLAAKKGIDCGPIAKGEQPLDDALLDEPCDGFRGVVDDWMQMLSRGVRRSALANSDSHGLYSVEAGMPRNYVRSDSDLPVQIQPEAIDYAVRDGAIVASYGPFVRFDIDGVEMGQPRDALHEVTSGKAVQVRIHVQSPLWFDVDRVELYRNSQVIMAWESCDRTPEDPDCIALPNDTVENLAVVFADVPPGDAWYVVTAVGVRGKDMAPVYSSQPLARFGFVESLDSLFEALPVGFGGGGAKAATVHSTLPYAITNPIYVDVDGDGWTPPAGDPPPWASN